MENNMTSTTSEIRTASDELARISSEEVAMKDAIAWRVEADLTGPPSDYEVKLAAALEHMVNWTRAGKFKPCNEEDVQCFLYHALVLQFDDATRIRTKLIHGSPSVLVGSERVGGMHFPDLVIGKPDGDPDAIYIELKVRAQTRKTFHQACLADVRKLAEHHSTHRQFFILYDCNPEVVYLIAAQSKELHDAAGKGCTVWHYPYKLNESASSLAAAKATTLMRARGLDFSALGSSNSIKANKSKLAKAQTFLAAKKAGVVLSGADGMMSAKVRSTELEPGLATALDTLAQQDAAESKASGNG